MSKAYSNRALPAGTVLREWSLEEVLGVGGFGIVYKARGIYFNELVAIKEYFPSSISERGEDETVVPVDSDAEEVHALGLKKFVEEAKLLWNLSTPTRHPNIVSVRSLFEIHGTAYMVMDFEDGTSLSRALKKGRKFNESSLRSMILPIAQGLERAHRVGVLHRDIKPPNIIINEDGRSVLIDFGSARFESGEATSTKVTFHTPPYAAIEQYVRTFPQGPWTDIYALGVVLYECITGTKPAEVLERMHGDAGTLLADGDWPGFSHTFLHAVDKAMAIRPDDRPQTISEWISLLDEDGTAKPDLDDDDDDEDEAATRIGSWNTEAQHIVPVAPTKEGFKPSDRRIETGVPDTPSKAEFSKRSDDSKATKKPAAKPAKGKEPKPADKAPQKPLNRAEESKAAAKEAAAKEAAAKPVAEAPSKPESTEVEGFVAKPPAPDKPTDQAKPTPKDKDASGKPPSAAKPAAAGSKDKDSQKEQGSKKPMIIGASAIALVAVAGWALSGSDSGSESTPLDSASAVPEAPLAAAVQIDAATAAKLIEEARAAGMQRELVAMLEPTAASESGEEGSTDEVVSLTALASFASVAVANAQSLVAAMPSAMRRSAPGLQQRLEAVETSEAGVSASDDAEQAVASTRELIGSFGKLNELVTATRRASRSEDAALAGTEAAILPVPTASRTPQAVATQTAASSGPVTDASKRSFARALDGARSVARQVIRLGDRNRPGSNASEQEKQDYRVRQGAATAARDYEKYLDGLEASMRGNITEADAIENTAKANQTRGYLSDLLKRSQLTLR